MRRLRIAIGLHARGKTVISMAVSTAFLKLQPASKQPTRHPTNAIKKMAGIRAGYTHTVGTKTNDANQAHGPHATQQGPPSRLSPNGINAPAQFPQIKNNHIGIPRAHKAVSSLGSMLKKMRKIPSHEIGTHRHTIFGTAFARSMRNKMKNIKSNATGSSTSPL